MNIRSVHAVARFGLGQRGAEPPPSDPEAWLADQLDMPDAALAEAGPDSASAFDVWHQEDIGNGEFSKGMNPRQPHFIGDRYQADRRAAMHAIIGSSQPFRERLVLFWANHFTVSARAGNGVLALVAAYVREAIRPHVTGSFEQMLSAVMHHPAMLYYLNNADSVGPSSPTGKAGRGLNENLARECLELHTVGVSSGYTQKDVTSFAKVLTGWSAERLKEPRGFVFRQEDHEPGPKLVMGQTFPEGYEGGVAALKWLAHHPATYRRLATQLVTHFVADDPDPKDVEAIAAVLQTTGGDLKATSLAVTRLPAAWQPLTKLRTPMDYVFAVYRALDFLPREPKDEADAYWTMMSLGQPYEEALLPNGWTDTAIGWLQGESLLRRADWAYAMAGRPDAPDAESLISVCAPVLADKTLSTVRGAGSRREALALLLASPEFMRR